MSSDTPASVPSEQSSEQVLLVDDNPTNLQVLYQTLEGRGYRLLVAKNGQDALAIARKSRPALLLLDIMMPDIDGYEVCQRIKQDPLTQEAAIIFLSALSDTKDKVKGLDLGAVDYITKPFQSDEVIARVDTHLKIHRLEQRLMQRNRQLEAYNQRILEAISEGICGLDRNGRATFVNPGVIEMTGWREEELIGQELTRVYQATQTETSCHTGIKTTLTKGQPYHDDSAEFCRSDGSIFPVELSSTPIYEDGQLSGAVLIFKDISERKRHERALRAALDEVQRLKERLQAENIYLQGEIKSEQNFGEIVGESEALRALLQQVRQVAPTTTSVLVQGESGTGKESIARAIHELSPRHKRPLIKVNCGAIAPNLIESELFGHVKGAFTGAVKNRVGHFELADGGTIFLDEVGELSLDAQVKLLRVLQEQEIERVGSSGSPIKVDVRVIAATNRDLSEMVQEQSFRLDLFYRLSVFPVTVPPLRDRSSDIPLLVESFLKNLSRKLGKPLTGISPAAMNKLLQYRWPGNIRELQNMLERASILAQSPVVEVHEVLEETPSNSNENASNGPAESSPRTLIENEYQHITRILEETNWILEGKNGAAGILDIPASTLRSRMKKLGIKRPSA